jgi:hypothetical protein
VGFVSAAVIKRTSAALVATHITISITTDHCIGEVAFMAEEWVKKLAEGIKEKDHHSEVRGGNETRF